MQKSPLKESNFQHPRSSQFTDYASYSSINNIPCPSIKIITPDKSNNQHTVRPLIKDSVFTLQTIKKTTMSGFHSRENLNQYNESNTKAMSANYSQQDISADINQDISVGGNQDQTIQLLLCELERIRVLFQDSSRALIETKQKLKLKEEIDQKQSQKVQVTESNSVFKQNQSWEEKYIQLESKQHLQHMEEIKIIQSSHGEVLVDLKFQFNEQLTEIQIMNNLCKAKLQDKVHECSMLIQELNQQRQSYFDMEDMEKRHGAEILGYTTQVMTLSNTIIHKDFELKQLNNKLNSYHSRNSERTIQWQSKEQTLEIEQLQEQLKDQQEQISIYNENLIRYSNKIKHHETEIAFQISQLEDKELWMNNYQELLDQLKQEKEVQRMKNINLAKKIREMNETSEHSDFRIAEQDVEIHLLKQRIEDIKQTKQWSKLGQ